MMSFPGISIFGVGKRYEVRIDEPLDPIAGEDELGLFPPDPLDAGLFLIPEDERDRWTDEHCEEVATAFEAEARAAQERKADLDKLIAERAKEIARPQIAGIRGDKRKTPSPTQAAAMAEAQRKSLEAARLEVLAARAEAAEAADAASAAPEVIPEQRVALQDVLSRVRLVCHKRFKEALRVSIVQAVPKLPGFLPGRDAVVLVEPMKSNKWVAQLAFQEGFAGRQYVRLGSSRAREFENAVLNDFDPDFVRSLEGKVVVLFDDASYSGNQMTGHIQVIARLVDRIKIRALLVIVPFMTHIARRKITAAAEEAKGLQVVIEGEAMPSLTEVPHPHRELLQTMWGYADAGRDVVRDAAGGAAEIPVDGIGLFCFTHKIPNQESFPVPLQRGTVYDPTGKPFRRRIHPTPLIDAGKFPPPYKRDSGSPSVAERGVGAAASDARENAVSEVEEIRSFSEVCDFLSRLGDSPATVRVFSDLDQTLVEEDRAAGTARLFEPTTLQSLRAIQEKFVVVGCTARNRDDALRTIEQLRSLGIILGGETAREQDRTVGNFRICEGVLFADTGSPGKGEGIKRGLRAEIRTVIFVGDKEDQVERVQASMREAGKNFYGFVLLRQ